MGDQPMQRSQLALLILAAVSFAILSARAFELDLTVREAANIARTAEPASGGIPLPAKTFRAGQQFALFDGAQEIPVQVLPLVVDAGNYLRWILVDFQTDIAARGVKTFKLRDVAPSISPATPLQVVEDSSGIEIDTGAVRVRISKTEPFRVVEWVKRNGQVIATGNRITYTDAFTDNVYTAGVPSRVTIEYAGPLRATVAVHGGFVGDSANELGYIARITAWSGRTDIHLKYSLANSHPLRYQYRQIKESVIELSASGVTTQTIIGAASPIVLSGNGWMHQGLYVYDYYQDVDGHTKVGQGTNVVWTGNGSANKVAGWIAAANVFVCDLFYADDPARILATEGSLLRLTGIAQRFDGPIDKVFGSGKRVGQPYGDYWRWLFDCSHLSSEYRIDFYAQDIPATLAARARAAQERLHIMAPFSWYFETESLVVGRFGTQADEMAAYNIWGWQYKPSDAPTTIGSSSTFKVRRYVRGEDNHYETEEDVVEALLLMYLRTGCRDFFTTAQAWANYNMDLQNWRTDGWQWKDGGVWWPMGGPLGNRPQRATDPVTGRRNSVPTPWGGPYPEPFDDGSVADLWFLASAKQCYCHNYGAGLAGWFCVTGERDALEACLDSVEQQYDTQKRAFAKVAGTSNEFSRDFTRSVYLTMAARLAMPTNAYVIEVSEWLVDVYLKRPRPEKRGLVVAADDRVISAWPPFSGWLAYVGTNGIAKLHELGIVTNSRTIKLTNPATGAEWNPVVDPHLWMYTPISMGLDCYYRITGNEDVRDWLIAYGQAVSYVFFQPKHGNLGGRLLVDFPIRGWAWDRPSWDLPLTSTNGEGIAISGYLARFHADVCAIAYGLCGEPFLKKRALDYWYFGSHRAYNATTMFNIGKVGMWANVSGVHDETVCTSGRTFYEWSHPHADTEPPEPVTDLMVITNEGKVIVSFSAPMDRGGGRVAEYQLKWSDRPIVDYTNFLAAFNSHTDHQVEGWWMAKNVSGEPLPLSSRTVVHFVLPSLPSGARYLALVSFDDSMNRSPISNLAQPQPPPPKGSLIVLR
ncbi:MAG: exo-rhamnogalacturonan lyase family protein [Kiritimatiellia bacterium]